MYSHKFRDKYLEVIMRYNVTMIRQLTGKIVDIQAGRAVLDVNGIGYYVATSADTDNWKLDDVVTLHTHLAVRETALDLYGFTSRDELAMFELLLTLPKVGPKTALQYLTQADITLIQQSVGMEDARQLSKLSGISIKTAEKIVMGLKDKIILPVKNATEESDATYRDEHTDAIEALISLGYPQTAAREAVRSVAKESPDVPDTAALINKSLKLLSKS